MFKSNKKIIILMVAVMVSISTVAYGEVYNLQSYNYNSQYSRPNDLVITNNYAIPNFEYTYNNNWGVIVVPVKPVTPPVVDKPVTPAPPTENLSGLSAMEMEVVRLVNIERQKAGLSNLKASTELSNVARMKSNDMAVNNYFSHTSPTYGSPFEMMKSFGIPYKTAGENIAKGYSSAQSVVNGWMNSQGHRDNILNSSFNTIGVGAYTGNGSTYWTQMFTN